MPNRFDSLSREDVIQHNLLLHDNTAAQYDQIHYYLRNRYEQNHLWRDLRLIHQRLERAVDGPVQYLDLGCGTGNLTLKLLALGGRVIGVDLSPRMVEVLTQKVATTGHAAHFRGLVGSADDLAALEKAHGCLADVQAVCVSSVLHHLFRWETPFDQLIELCPALRAVYVTHEPCSRASLTPPNALQRLYNRGLRGFDRLWSRTIRRPQESHPDDPIADYHAFKDGIDEEQIAKMLGAHGFTERPIHRRYNMRRTTQASLVDNVVCRALRNDIFPITMFTLALMRG